MTLFQKRIDEMRPQPLLVLGATIHVLGLYLSSFLDTFTSFIFVYAIIGGIGIGLIEMLPLKCAWSFFPNHKPIMTFLIMGTFYFSATFGAQFSTYLINPLNNQPDIIVTNGQQMEKFYAGEYVLKVPQMLQIMSFATLAFYLVALVIIETKEPEYMTESQSEELSNHQITDQNKEKQLKSPLIPLDEKLETRNNFNLFTI